MRIELIVVPSWGCIWLFLLYQEWGLLWETPFASDQQDGQQPTEIRMKLAKR